MLSLIISIVFGGIGVLLSTYISAYARSSLNQYPGPVLAKFTNWWRVYHSLDSHTTQFKLHKYYGPVVRTGPNCISLNDAKLIKTVYDARGTFLKSDFYAVNDIIQNGHYLENAFSTRSNDYHRRFLRPIQKLYSLGNILTLEPLADETTTTFCRRLEEEFIGHGDAKGKSCDLVEWIKFYTWDVMGRVTFDQPIGFLEQGGDINGMLKTADDALYYFQIVGNMPALDKWLAKNPYRRFGGPTMDWAGAYAAERMKHRYQTNTTDQEPRGASNQYRRSKPDFLDSFMHLKESDPEFVTEETIVGYMLINLLAGADTTAIALAAIFYYLLKNPHKLEKLMAELDAANLNEPISYREAEQLPYLSAVVREAMRLHPSLGVLLERIVPQGGLALSDGSTLPPGTIVGMNPWVIHRDADIYGDDVEQFVPERWLKKEGENDHDFKARTKRMKDAELTFGAGNRTCLGKWLALMEIYKIVPTLLLRYRFELVEPEREWNVRSAFFMVQDKLEVTISQRGAKSS